MKKCSKRQIVQELKFSVMHGEKKNKIIVSELSNEFSRKIIFSIVSKAKSGIEIAADTKIPQSTVYKKIPLLLKLELIRKNHEDITDKGRPVEFFISNIKKAEIIISGYTPHLSLFRNRK